MNALRNLVGALILLTIEFYAASALAQQTPTAAPEPCIAANEPVYRPGEDGVKPPQPPAPDKDAKSAFTIHAPVSLELLINSAGHICEARILAAKDPSNAKEFADEISRHWTFKPASRKGKPVAVRIRLNWNAGR